MPQTPRHRPIARHLREFAKNIRREPTHAEAAMWRLRRDRRLSAFKFRRQVPFKSYILDFVCFEKCLIIEIDGSQHADSQRDSVRAAALASEGFQTARYWNNDVLQPPVAVLEDILAKLTAR
jgi:very-short-patch-repair endonuclease